MKLKGQDFAMPPGEEQQPSTLGRMPFSLSLEHKRRSETKEIPSGRLVVYVSSFNRDVCAARLPHFAVFFQLGSPVPKFTFTEFDKIKVFL